MKIGIVLGTRPEIIKMSPIIDEIIENDHDYIIIHTGQHYDINMSRQFFNDLELPLPGYNIGIGSNTPLSQISIIINQLEEILIKEEIDILLVQGDTNAVLAGAISANKLNIPVGHVEAGLRSFDKEMPEEINRLVADNCSMLYFVPTHESAINLQNEGIDHENIYVTGNTVVDACQRNLEIALNNNKLEETIEYDDFILLTMHRHENVDNKERLTDIVESLVNLEHNIVLPLHPHTRGSLTKWGLLEKLEEAPNIQITKPLGYLDFLHLLSMSKLVLTDSGGLQEEAITLNIPCVTLRYNTERPETITAGGNILAGSNPEEIRNNIENILNNRQVYEKMSQARNPYGDGDSSKKILSIITKKYMQDKLKITSTNQIRDFKGYKLIQITDDTTIKEYEEKHEGHIVQQVFNKQIPEYIHPELKLENKTIIIKEFQKKKK
ncbi:MAG: UDP-N-acetylglucosamine 2-epimerase (non-hydrolyzing) [Methanosphaera sp.]|nr:UDP-N-acetylglucosamine 2-epimerase (non-hydrolyzing) [Methanosphaera sp.]